MDASGACLWLPVSPLPNYAIETLFKSSVFNPDWDHEYVINLRVNREGVPDDYDESIVWNNAAPGVPDFPPSCFANYVLLNNDLIPKQVDMHPVPDWMCTQEQLDNWNP